MKKLVVLVIFLFSLVNSSLAQGVVHLIYNPRHLFFSRSLETGVGGSVGIESIAWELIAIALIILVLLFQLPFAPESYQSPKTKIKFHWSNFLPGICFILVMTVYIFYFGFTFYGSLGIIACLITLFLSMDINRKKNWTFSGYLTIKVLNLLFITLTVVAMTHSWLSAPAILMGPLIIFVWTISAAISD